MSAFDARDPRDLDPSDPRHAHSPRPNSGCVECERLLEEREEQRAADRERAMPA